MSLHHISTLNYGPTISSEEFENKVTALHLSTPPISTPHQDQRVRHGELNALIDHKLGTGFPVEKRKALWAIQRKLDRKRLLHVLSGLLTSPLKPSRALTKPQLKGYATVLNPSEMHAFFGCSAAQIEELTR